jgi:hypothetical protein
MRIWNSGTPEKKAGAACIRGAYPWENIGSSCRKAENILGFTKIFLSS